MEQNIMQLFYETWVESKDYHKNSALENETYKSCIGKITEIIGEEVYREVGDNIVNLACEAEVAGFESGVRYGIMFMSGMLKGGVTA